MKRFIWIPGLIVLCLPWLSCASEIPDFPFVFAQGQTEVEVAPDVATIFMQVEAYNEDPGKALSAVENRSAELVSAFTKHKVDKKDMIAYDINKRTVRETKNYTQLGILGYEVSRRITVTVRYLDQYEPLMTNLLSLKNVTNLHAEFDRTDRRTIEAGLITQASQKAREQATLLAKGFGAEIASVHAISASRVGFGNIAGEFGMGAGYTPVASMARGERAETTTIFVPSTIKMQASVNAIFRLK
jgi:uncharacterized protein